MRPSEFKAWFEGFTEGLSGAPTKEQFAKIKAKVAKIDGSPITERIFLDTYWPRQRHYEGWRYLTANCSSATSAAASEPFNSTSAMYALGKSESIAA